MSICFRVLLFLEDYIKKLGIIRLRVCNLTEQKKRVFLKLYKMPKLSLKISTLTILSDIRVLTARKLRGLVKIPRPHPITFLLDLGFLAHRIY